MIQTKVARIDSDTRLILAAGIDSRVKEGMTFIIYELGEEIIDPETGRSLGRIEHIKGRVVVEHVQDHLSVARTKIYERSIDIFAGGLGKSYLDAVRRMGSVEQEKLPIESAHPISTPSELRVRVGDLARSVD